MKIIIKGSGIEITDAIEEYIKKKSKPFERPMSSIVEGMDIHPIEERKERVEVFWDVGTESSGEKRGMFFCKGQIIAPGEELFTAYVKSGDLYAAIDSVKDILTMQIVRRKEKSDTKEKGRG